MSPTDRRRREDYDTPTRLLLEIVLEGRVVDDHDTPAEADLRSRLAVECEDITRRGGGIDLS